jgi:hypothetical protein
MSNRTFQERVGETARSKQGYKLVIKEYRSNSDCDILIFENSIIKNATYQNFKSGLIKNPYHPSVCGVGYLGEGKYIKSISGKVSLAYAKWSSMLSRCYTKKFISRYPTYINCSVDERWHNFQIFAEWFEENYREGFELDKDILVKGNKVYSPETCCFVPAEVNTILVKNDSRRGELPIGVSKNGTKFQAHITASTSRPTSLGTYNTVNEAFSAYKNKKEEHIKNIANKWSSSIEEDVYKALINYQVEIYD